MSKQHYRKEELLTQRETFERYERPTSAQNYNQPLQGYRQPEPISQYDYRQVAPQPVPRSTSHQQPQLACEYRRPYDDKRYPSGEHGQLACEYRQAASPQPQIACEYRRDPRIEDAQPYKPQTTIRTYLPSTSDKKVPLGLIIGIAIAVPILIIVILFGAVWLQELGIL